MMQICPPHVSIIKRTSAFCLPIPGRALHEERNWNLIMRPGLTSEDKIKVELDSVEYNAICTKIVPAKG